MLGGVLPMCQSRSPEPWWRRTPEWTLKILKIAVIPRCMVPHETKGLREITVPAVILRDKPSFNKIVADFE